VVFRGQKLEWFLEYLCGIRNFFSKVKISNSIQNLIIFKVKNLQLINIKMAGKSTPLSKALSLWEEKNGKPAA